MPKITELVECFEGRVTLFRREGSAFWYTRYYVGNQKYKEKSLKTKDLETAKTCGLDFHFETRAQVTSGVPLLQLTMAKAGDLFLKNAEEMVKNGVGSASMLRNSKLIYKATFLPYFKDRTVTSLHPNEHVAFYRWRLEKAGKAPAKQTIRPEISFVNAVVAFCEDHDYIKRGIVPRMKVPKEVLKQAQKTGSYFTDDELERLLTRLREVVVERGSENEIIKILGTLVPVMLYSGMRTNDYLKLRRRDVKGYEDKEGKRQYELHLRGKSSATIKEKGVVVREECHPALVLRFLQLTDDNPETLIFKPSKRQFRVLSETFHELLKEFDLYKDADGNGRSLYSLRHNYATASLRRGNPIDVVARNMRTSVAEIERTYSHVMNQMNSKHLT